MIRLLGLLFLAVVVTGCATATIVVVDPTVPGTVYAARGGRLVAPRDGEAASVAACVARREGALAAFAPEGARVVAASRAEAALRTYWTKISGCAFEGLEVPAEDERFLPVLLHEATHLLGTAATLRRPAEPEPPPGSVPTSYGTTDDFVLSSTRRWEVYFPGEKHDRLAIPFVRGTPAIAAIGPTLDAELMPLAKIYFVDPRTVAIAPAKRPARMRSGNFYLLWDEWNAFVATLELDTAVARRDGCFLKPLRDFYNGVLQWPIFAETYLAALERSDAALAGRLMDTTFRRSLARMLDRTEASLAAAQPFSCLSQGLSVAKLEAASAAARRALRARAR